MGNCRTAASMHEAPLINDCEQVLHLLNPQHAYGQARSRVQQVTHQIQEITLEVRVSLYLLDFSQKITISLHQQLSFAPCLQQCTWTILIE